MVAMLDTSTKSDTDGGFMIGVGNKRQRLMSSQLVLAPEESVPLDEVSFEPDRVIEEVVVVETGGPSLDLTQESMVGNVIGLGDGDESENTNASTPDGVVPAAARAQLPPGGRVSVGATAGTSGHQTRRSTGAASVSANGGQSSQSCVPDESRGSSRVASRAPAVAPAGLVFINRFLFRPSKAFKPV